MKVEHIEIGPRIYSDHTPLFINWSLKVEKTRDDIWRLDNYLLLNEEVVTKVHQELDIFWQANKETENKILLWETFKVFVHGILIGQKAYLKRLKDKIVLDREL